MKLNLICVFLLFVSSTVIKADTTGSEGKLINLQTKDLSMIMTVGSDEVLYFQYFGRKIEDASPYLEKQTYRREDYGTDLHAYLAAGGSNYREPALLVTHPDGDLNTELSYVGHRQEELHGGNVVRTIIILEDRKQPLTVELVVTAYQEENVYTQKVDITNRQKQESITLHNFYSSYLPVQAKRYYLNSFHGAWAQEMFMQESLLSHGVKTIENRMGVRTTHTENPSFVLALNMPLNENVGDVIGGALAWSGNYKLNFEVDEFDILGITAGMNPYASAYTLEAGETFHTPEMIYTYSTSGAGGVSRNLHDWARRYQVYDAGTIRPTLLNSWEGAYFTFDEKTITDMIDDTADMGLEMFVLDDGWFGNKYPRESSRQGLGDWQVTRDKLPRGVSYLADYTVSKGLQFGIWIEPEMVNPKSELAENHPDWIVQAKGRPVPTTREQWILDLTNPDVQDFIFNVFDNVMQQSNNISYIKWDANRHVQSVGSSFLPADKQSHFWIEYIQGLYSVYERIRAKYPHVLIQACSSGGGRVDYGALKYHQEVWTSDNTDARSRIFIQYGTNMIYPALVTGSHVSEVPNHQTGNVTPLKFRFDMAMSGRFGMELQPKNLSEEEKEFAKIAIENYKDIRDIVMKGDLYRLISPYEGKGLYAIMFVSKDKKRAVVFDYCFEYRGRTRRSELLKLHGLDSTKRYMVTELNVKKSSFWGNNKVFSGEYLIHEGVNPRLEKMYESAVLLLESVD